MPVSPVTNKIFTHPCLRLLRFHLGGLHSCLDGADVEAICRSHLVNPGVDATAGLLLRQLRSVAQELLDQPLHHTESSVSVSSLVSSLVSSC